MANGVGMFAYQSLNTLERSLMREAVLGGTVQQVGSRQGEGSVFGCIDETFCVDVGGGANEAGALVVAGAGGTLQPFRAVLVLMLCGHLQWPQTGQSDALPGR